MRIIEKCLIPLMVSLILLAIFHPVYCHDQEIDYLIVWVLSGLSFGISRMFLWMIPMKMDLPGSIGLIVFNFVIAGIIGGFIAIWYLMDLLIKIICYGADRLSGKKENRI